MRYHHVRGPEFSLRSLPVRVMHAYFSVVVALHVFLRIHVKFIHLLGLRDKNESLSRDEIIEVNSTRQARKREI